MSVPPYLEGLNAAQRDAVEHTTGPLLVLAGAGAGKTRVITHRIVHLIHQGVAPHHILAVTFTNKAAREMRERVEALVRQYPPSDRAVIDSLPVVTTFHALGVRLLREFHEAMNLRRHFVIYDRSDSVRAVKSALEQKGYSPKQFEPRRILSMISRAKGDAITQSSYAADASTYPERVAAEVWEAYDAHLASEHALDFDDLLAKTLRLLLNHPPILTQLQQRYQYLHIDEYQDTNRVQFKLAELLAGAAHNICVVGDLDQCVPGDTNVTMANGSPKQIRSIKVGDMVLSNYGSGDLRPAPVTNVHTHGAPESLVTITTTSEKSLRSTPNHIHFAGFRLGISTQHYFVYLMYKKGMGWRIGVTSVYTKGQKMPMLGFVQRLNHEHGDAIWIVETHNAIQDARAREYVLSLNYRVPTLPFIARKGTSTGGYVHDQTVLDRIFSEIDTKTGAMKMLRDFNLDEQYPHHRPQVSKSKRQNILVTLCGDRRGKTPMHHISVAGSSPKTKKILRDAGYSIRQAKAGALGWRFETCNKSYGEILRTIDELRALLPEAIVTHAARLGVSSGTTREKCSLPCIPAASVRPGMVMFSETGTYEIVKGVSYEDNEMQVYDIDISPTHNYIANGLCTHNSIYSWRGADIKNVLQFEKHFPEAKTILLEENYRSTQTIIAASNDIIKRNQNRVEKNVFTNNEEGEKITLYAAMNGIDEAEHVVMTAKKLMGDGVSPADIAVLYRTNFQSRALEEAFLNYEVPYQLLGTKFFERKEVKDVLSYLRLALNPGSTADLARIVNVPTRGIGKVTLLKLIEGKRDAINGATLEKVNRFDQMMMDIADEARTKTISETIKFIIKRSGLEADFTKEGTEDALSRLENLRELVTLATRYDELGPDEGVEALLENAALQSDQDELQSKEEREAVRLMTVHAAKGLEFPYVFITGLEEGLFPHERLDDERVDHEEERRLFYVALTRAGKKVFLSYAHMRTIFGSQRVNVPSQFLNDISTEHVESNQPRGFGDPSSGYETTVFLD